MNSQIPSSARHRANAAHIRQSGPDSGPGPDLRVKVSKPNASHTPQPQTHTQNAHPTPPKRTPHSPHPTQNTFPHFGRQRSPGLVPRMRRDRKSIPQSVAANSSTFGVRSISQPSQPRLVGPANRSELFTPFQPSIDFP